MADGYLGKCKDCTKKDVRKHRRENDSVREYDRDRYYLDPARQLRIRENVIDWRINNPEGYKAHMIVNNAVRDGNLIKKNCEVCGDTKSHAHHDDYSKPLDVKWFCAKHHQRLHHPSEND